MTIADAKLPLAAEGTEFTSDGSEVANSLVLEKKSNVSCGARTLLTNMQKLVPWMITAFLSHNRMQDSPKRGPLKKKKHARWGKNPVHACSSEKTTHPPP